MELKHLGTQLATFQQEQGAAADAAKTATATQAAARKDFYTKFMRPIARIAQARVKKGAPEFASLIVPLRGLRKAQFPAAAQTLTDTAAQHEADLLTGGMVADFLTQMKAALAQLVAATAASDESTSRRQAATQGIAAASLAARDAIVVLDAAIVPAVKSNASLLADWKASKRITVPTTLPPQPVGLAPTTAATPATSASPAVTSPAPTAPAPAPASQTATSAG